MDPEAATRGDVFWPNRSAEITGVEVISDICCPATVDDLFWELVDDMLAVDLAVVPGLADALDRCPGVPAT